MLTSLPHDVLSYWCRLVLKDACHSDDDASFPAVARLARSCRVVQTYLLGDVQLIERLCARRLEQRVARLVCACIPSYASIRKRQWYLREWRYTALAFSLPRQWQVTIGVRRLEFVLNDDQLMETIREWLTRLQVSTLDVDTAMACLRLHDMEPVPGVLVDALTPRGDVNIVFQRAVLHEVEVLTIRTDHEYEVDARHLLHALLCVAYPTLRVRHEALSRHGRW